MKHQQESTVLWDTVIVVVILATVAATVFNTVRTVSLADTVAKQQKHLCWMTETLYGPPGDTDTDKACLALQGRLLEED